MNVFRKKSLARKVADIVPVLKDDKLPMGNTHPISLLSIFEKIAEKFILDNCDSTPRYETVRNTKAFVHIPCHCDGL